MPEFDLDAALTPVDSGQISIFQRDACALDDDVGLEPGQTIQQVKDVFAKTGAGHTLIGSLYQLSQDQDVGGRDSWVAAYPDWMPQDELSEEWWDRQTWWRTHQPSEGAAMHEVLVSYTQDFGPGMAAGCANWEDYANTGGIATGRRALVSWYV